jgi:uncharacterized OB-fold protein
MTPPPATRSRAARGLAVAAAEGRFALQVCAACGATQYPPRDVCFRCLSDALPWREVARGGVLRAVTTIHVSSELYFRERAPWRVGLVELDAGPTALAHLDSDCVAGERVTLDLELDSSGCGAIFASPEAP